MVAQVTSTNNTLGPNGVTAIQSTTSANYKLSVGGAVKVFGTGTVNTAAAPVLLIGNTTASTGRRYGFLSNNNGYLQVYDSTLGLTRFILNGSLGRIGIGAFGTAAAPILPDSALHVIGGFKLVNGSQGAGKILTSDASGGAIWQTPLTGVTSFIGRTGVVIAAANDYTFTQIAAKPTTIAGYGITDAAALNHTHLLDALSNLTITTPSNGQILTYNSTTSKWINQAPAVNGVTSFSGRTGAVIAAANDYSFSQIAAKPTTISGYGITDVASSHTHAIDTLSNVTITTPSNGQVLAYNSATSKWTNQTAAANGVTFFNGRTGNITPAANDYSFAQISGTPTSLAGYGITNAALLSHTHLLDSLSNVFTTDKLVNDQLKWNGTNWVSFTPTVPLPADSSKWVLIGNNIFSKNSGNIGIGTTAPSAKLHTNGTVRFQNYSNNTAEDSILTTDINGNLKLKLFAPATTVVSNLQQVTTAGKTTTDTITVKSIISNSDAVINGSIVGRGPGTTTANIIVGSNAFLNNTTGVYNTAIGDSALRSNTTGNNNTAIGASALKLVTTSGNNTAIGVGALYVNTAAANTAVGSSSMVSNTTGTFNAALGATSLYANTTGSNNAAVGYWALRFNTTGSENVAFGTTALRENTTGNKNIALGRQAMSQNTTGSNKVGIGYQSGFNNNGDGNIFLGYQAGFNEAGSNKLYIANSNTATPLIGGDFVTGYAGIGTVNPTEKLEVMGKVKATGLILSNLKNNAALDSVLTTDTLGNLKLKSLGAVLASSGWGLTGNAGTTPATNFIGTTDNNDIVFKRNGIKSGLISADNIAFGINNLSVNTTGVRNVAIGTNSLAANTTGNYNVANGANTLPVNTSGHTNVATGDGALNANTSGHTNAATGAYALLSNTTGISNTATGTQALSSNTTGNYNVATGRSSLNFNTSGSDNIATGLQSLYNTTGSNNVAAGSYSFLSNTTGSNNVGIGYRSNVSTGNLTNAIAIGTYAYVAQSNSMVLGSINGVNGASANTNVGIGTSSPAAQLHTTGTVRLANFKNNAAEDSVLTTDVLGNVKLKAMASVTPTTPSLQQVTDVNDTTTNIIYAPGIASADNKFTLFSPSGVGTLVLVNASDFATQIKPPLAGTGNTINLPNQNGNLAISVQANGNTYLADNTGKINLGTIGGGTPITLTTTGTGAATLVGSVLNIPTPVSGGGGSGGADDTKWKLRSGNIYSTDNANVGIGVDSATAKFHTLGTVRLASFKNNLQGDSVLTTDADGNLKMIYMPYGSGGGSGSVYTFANGLSQSNGIVSLGGQLEDSVKINMAGFSYGLNNGSEQVLY